MTAYTKGAVDEMLPLCTHILTAEGIRPITDEDKNNISELCLTMSENAMRLLGFATKNLSSIPLDDNENIEHDMVFIGATGYDRSSAQ